MNRHWEHLLVYILLVFSKTNNDVSDKSCLVLSIEPLGRDVTGEVESDWMVPLLVEVEMDRLMAWQLGVSL